MIKKYKCKECGFVITVNPEYMCNACDSNKGFQEISKNKKSYKNKKDIKVNKPNEETNNLPESAVFLGWESENTSTKSQHDINISKNKLN